MVTHPSWRYRGPSSLGNCRSARSTLRDAYEVAAGTVPMNVDSIEIETTSSDRPKAAVTPPDYRDVVRDRIQVTRCADSQTHLGGAASLLHGHVC